MAVKQEHLGQWEGALHSYGESVVMAEQQWGPEHAKTHAIRHSYQQAKDKLARKGGRLPKIERSAATLGGAPRERAPPDTHHTHQHHPHYEAPDGPHGSKGAKRKPGTLPALAARYGPDPRRSLTLGCAISAPPLAYADVC
jgi:hypothetical protein